jgi:hypothetical protein
LRDGVALGRVTLGRGSARRMVLGAEGVLGRGWLGVRGEGGAGAAVADLD